VQLSRAVATKGIYLTRYLAHDGRKTPFILEWGLESGLGPEVWALAAGWQGRCSGRFITTSASRYNILFR